MCTRTARPFPPFSPSTRMRWRSFWIVSPASRSSVSRNAPCRRARCPAKPEQLSQGSVSRDNLYKGEPSHQAYCEKLVDDNHMVLGSTYLPPGYNEITVAPPGTQGGVNYYGGSFDPKLHLFVA